MFSDFENELVTSFIFFEFLFLAAVMPLNTRLSFRSVFFRESIKSDLVKRKKKRKIKNGRKASFTPHGLVTHHKAARVRIIREVQVYTPFRRVQVIYMVYIYSRWWTFFFFYFFFSSKSTKITNKQRDRQYCYYSPKADYDTAAA